MNFNRRKRDGALVPQITATELRWFLDVQALLLTASKVDDKPLYKDAARLLGDAIKELERPAAAKK
jgi:uncharacterized membrane protein YfbV (UPF0208 family)